MTKNRFRRWLIRRLGGEILEYNSVSLLPKSETKLTATARTSSRRPCTGEIQSIEKEYAARHLGEYMLQCGYIKFSLEDDYAYEGIAERLVAEAEVIVPEELQE